jgi:hypothetical protein
MIVLIPITKFAIQTTLYIKVQLLEGDRMLTEIRCIQREDNYTEFRVLLDTAAIKAIQDTDILEKIILLRQIATGDVAKALYTLATMAEALESISSTNL